MELEDLKKWRKAERGRLIAARMAVPDEIIVVWRQQIDQWILRSFPGLAHTRLAFCWPVRNEYDPRHVVMTLREQGAITALPVVVAARQPLAFREWHPGVELASGPLDIP